MRVGFGYDIHALKKGRRLVLGGVELPFSKGLAGHSDGDALFHAIADALLGALGQGDLGDHFPDTDARFKNADSRLFLKKIKGLLAAQRLQVTHIDSTVITEAPKLAVYRQKMRQNIAAALGLDVTAVSVKAKTNEGFGAVGKKQAIACYAVAAVAPLKKGARRAG